MRSARSSSERTSFRSTFVPPNLSATASAVMDSSRGKWHTEDAQLAYPGQAWTRDDKGRQRVRCRPIDRPGLDSLRRLALQRARRERRGGAAEALQQVDGRLLLLGGEAGEGAGEAARVLGEDAAQQRLALGGEGGVGGAAVFRAGAALHQPLLLQL